MGTWGLRRHPQGRGWLRVVLENFKRGYINVPTLYLLMSSSSSRRHRHRHSSSSALLSKICSNALTTSAFVSIKKKRSSSNAC